MGRRYLYFGLFGVLGFGFLVFAGVFAVRRSGFRVDGLGTRFRASCLSWQRELGAEGGLESP